VAGVSPVDLDLGGSQRGEGDHLLGGWCSLELPAGGGVGTSVDVSF
jgi:hypothetical protein